MLPLKNVYARCVLVVLLMCIFQPDRKTTTLGSRERYYDPNYGDYDYDYDYLAYFNWRFKFLIPTKYPDYTCFYFERFQHKKYDPLCYHPNATAFPGVSWQQLKENWHYWSDYPCIYYTEEAFLATTNENVSQTDVLCDYRHYYFSDGAWTSNRHRINFRSVRLDVVDLDYKLRAFFAKRDNQGSLSLSILNVKGYHSNTLLGVSPRLAVCQP